MFSLWLTLLTYTVHVSPEIALAVAAP